MTRRPIVGDLRPIFTPMGIRWRDSDESQRHPDPAGRSGSDLLPGAAFSRATLRAGARLAAALAGAHVRGGPDRRRRARASLLAGDGNAAAGSLRTLEIGAVGAVQEFRAALAASRWRSSQTSGKASTTIQALPI